MRVHSPTNSSNSNTIGSSTMHDRKRDDVMSLPLLLLLLLQRKRECNQLEISPVLSSCLREFYHIS